VGTESGHPEKAQNNNPGPGKKSRWPGTGLSVIVSAASKGPVAPAIRPFSEIVLMREPMKLFSVVVLFGASMALLSAAQAQNGPWCAHYDFGSDETVTYTTAATSIGSPNVWS
jgi:hypothetical protein